MTNVARIEMRRFLKFITILGVFVTLAFSWAIFTSQLCKRHDWQTEMVKIAKRGDTISSAIETYFMNNQRLPESLEQLVPDYLPRIPRPGIVDKNYCYHVNTLENEYFKEMWLLKINVFTITEAVEIVYSPSGKLPDTSRIGGKLIVTHGNWGCYQN